MHHDGVQVSHSSLNWACQLYKYFNAYNTVLASVYFKIIILHLRTFTYVWVVLQQSNYIINPNKTKETDKKYFFIKEYAVLEKADSLFLFKKNNKENVTYEFFAEKFNQIVLLQESSHPLSALVGS